MVFNYDKATGKVGSNKNNLENALTEVKDFFLKKQDIEKPYTLSKDEYSFFERMKKELSDSQLNGSAEDSKDAMLQLAEEITGADSSLVKYIQDTDVASVSQVGFAQSQKTVIQGTTKFSAVMKTAGGVAKSFVATLGSMAVAAAAAWAIGKVIEGIDYLYHYDENIIKAGQEAKDSIGSTFKSFEEGKQSIMDLGSSFGNQTEQIKNTGDAIDQVAEKYVELRKGVNQNTNENVSLSTDEYQQYIDLSSKLASQFPGLVAGYDSQGNAVLNLASNADKAADSIRNLYEAQVSSANVDMGKNLQATYDGVVTQTSQYAEDIQKKRDELEQLDTDISENKRSILTYGSNNFEVQGLYGDKENVITDVLKENGLYKENTGDDGSIWNFYAEGLADKSKKEIDRMNEQITAGLESYNLSLETQRSQLQSEINSYDLMIEDQWRSMAQSLGNYLQTSKSFNELDDSLQSAFLANISNLDLTALNDPDGKYQGQVLDFLYGEFIGPMSRFSADVQESLADALQIDPSKLTIDEYKSQVDEAFNKAFPKEEDADKRDRFKNAYGIDSSIEDMEDNASRLKEAYADFPNASDFIDHMQTGDLSIAAQLIDNGSVDIEKGTDGLVSAIERYKKTVAEAKSDTTLASVLGDSDNEISSSIDSLQSDIQSKYNSLISSNSSLQNDMLSLVKNQAQAELDALNKVISKRKEALSAKKDYYDYDKTLKDKTKDIQILERQAAALQGSTNAEDKARLAKIQEQLSDAREDLSDTMTDHAFSMQSDALDKLSSDMSDDFDKWSNDISSNVEKMSKAINEAVSNSALSNAQVLNNLSTILKNVGLTDEQVSSTLSGLTGYASGTDYVPKSGMYRVNENGMESVLSRKYGTLTFLNQGDKVFTADFTKRLIDNAGIATQSSQPQFGEMYKELMNAITNTNNQSFGDMTVNFYIDGAKDIDALKTEIYGTMKQVLRDHDKKQVRDFKSLR